MARWAPLRRDLIEALAEEILHNYGHGRVIVAIDGEDIGRRRCVRRRPGRAAQEARALGVRGAAQRLRRAAGTPRGVGSRLRRGQLPQHLRLLGAAPRADRPVPDGRQHRIRRRGLRPGARAADPGEVAHRAARTRSSCSSGEFLQRPELTRALELHGLAGVGAREDAEPVDKLTVGGAQALRQGREGARVGQPPSSTSPIRSTRCGCSPTAASSSDSARPAPGTPARASPRAPSPPRRATAGSRR